jgi:hypothetical protein
MVHGSFSDTVFTLPVFKECTLATRARTSGALWWSMLVVLVLFLGIVLPLTVRIPMRGGSS